jgi:nucleotide-binding universal stress UspA family protein
MKILIPLDGSRFSEDILEPIMRLANRSDKIVSLHLVRVVKTSDARITWNEAARSPTEVASIWTYGGIYSYDTPLEPLKPWPNTPVDNKDQALDRLYNEAKDYLDRVAEHLFPYVTDKTVVFGDDPAEEIINYVRREEIDLMAIATHGRTGLARMLFGSVARKLAKADVVPIFTVRPGDKHEGAIEPESLAAMETEVHREPAGRGA